MSNRLLIRDQVSVEAALDMLGLEPPDQAGKICCPFHDEVTASCHVYDDHINCYGCGFNGDVVWFVAQVTGTSIWRAEQFLMGAVDELAPVVRREPMVREVQDLSVLFREQTDTGPFIRSMAEVALADKPFDLCWAETFGWGVGRDGIWVPHFHDDQMVGVKVRKYNGSKVAVPGSTFTLAPYLAWRHDPTWAREAARQGYRSGFVVCEGESDTLAMQARLPLGWSAIGLPAGAAAAHDMIVAWLAARPGGELRLALDADAAGRSANAQLWKALSSAGLASVDLTPSLALHGGDVCDALRNGWKPQF